MGRSTGYQLDGGRRRVQADASAPVPRETGSNGMPSVIWAGSCFGLTGSSGRRPRSRPRDCRWGTLWVTPAAVRGVDGADDRRRCRLTPEPVTQARLPLGAERGKLIETAAPATKQLSRSLDDEECLTRRDDEVVPSGTSRSARRVRARTGRSRPGGSWCRLRPTAVRRARPHAPTPVARAGDEPVLAGRHEPGVGAVKTCLGNDGRIIRVARTG